MKITIMYLSLLMLTTQKGFSQDITTNDFSKAWDNMTKMVVETAKKMPAETFTYRPDKEIRSFGEQINHITKSNISLGTMVFGKMPDFPIDPNNPPTEKNAIIDLLEKSCAYFKAHLEQLKNKDLSKKITWGRNGKKVTKLQGLLMIYSHFQLEYGKITIYARANHIAPHPSGGWLF